jgi:hypothetical protein
MVFIYYQRYARNHSNDKHIKNLYDNAGNSDYLSFVEDILTTNDDAGALFELFPDNAASSKKFGFSGIITNAEYGATLGEIQEINITFQTSGAITSDI